MDEMENKLETILNNPQMMEKIMALAQNMGQQNTPQQPESSPPQMPDIDLSMVQRLSGFAKQSGIDKKQQDLLRALGPYLNRQRISRLERAMRAAKMAGMATTFLSQKGR